MVGPFAQVIMKWQHYQVFLEPYVVWGEYQFSFVLSIFKYEILFLSMVSLSYVAEISDLELFDKVASMLFLSLEMFLN